jgi:hypothetical protein
MPRSTIDFDIVKKIGLTLPCVEASTAWGAPALKVRGKMLACVPTRVGQGIAVGDLLGIRGREADIATIQRSAISWLMTSLCCWGRFQRNRSSGIADLCRCVPAATVLSTFDLDLDLLDTAGSVHWLGVCLNHNGNPSLYSSLRRPQYEGFKRNRLLTTVKEP